MNILIIFAVLMSTGYALETEEYTCDCTPLISIQDRGVNVGPYTDPRNRLNKL